MKVELYVPCFVNHLYPDTAKNVKGLLEQLNVTVNYKHDQQCCGQPFYNSGFCDDALPLAEKFVKLFTDNIPIVMPSASCAAFVRNYYSEILKDDIFLQKFNQISNHIFELCDFIVNVLNIKDVGAIFPHKVTFHDSCAALREYHLGDEPRMLLRNVKGLELIEMNDTHVCCGFGGTFSMKFEPISVAMVQQKVEFALKTGAEYICSTEASCLLNYESYIKKNQLAIKTIHIADILATKE